MDFPLLYSYKNNQFRVWSIRVSDECEIIRTYGVEHGNQTVSVKKITAGKNLGKKNETTPFEQACAEATSMFEKQKTTAGYRETRSKEPMVPTPMLAHAFDKSAHRVVYPAFVQPKLDGVRMITCFDPSRGDVVFMSRTGKPLDALKPVFGPDLARLLVTRPGLWLDGEVYSRDLTFEEIVSAVRNEQNPDPNTLHKLEYHVYDVITDRPESPFHERHMAVQEVLKNTPNWIQSVPTYSVSSADEVLRHHDEFVQQGYEGVMIRNRDGPYVYKRSYDLQKFKNFRDDEFVITDVKEATGNDAGTAIIQCKTEDGQCFWVRPRGTREYRAELLRRKKYVLYKQLTVRYQNLTDKNIPRFPVGITIRDYE